MFITGHFVASYNGVYIYAYAPVSLGYSDLGQTEQGWEIVEAHLVQDIVTDSGGDAPMDGVMRGTRMEIRGTYVDYDLIKVALYSANPRGHHLDNVGQLMTTLAGPLILTPTVGSSAAADLGAGNSIIFHKAIILNDINTLLSTRHRKGPITFRAYPDPIHSYKVYDIQACTNSSS